MVASSRGACGMGSGGKVGWSKDWRCGGWLG